MQTNFTTIYRRNRHTSPYTYTYRHTNACTAEHSLLTASKRLEQRMRDVLGRIVRLLLCDSPSAEDSCSLSRAVSRRHNTTASLTDTALRPILIHWEMPEIAWVTRVQTGGYIRALLKQFDILWWLTSFTTYHSSKSTRQCAWRECSYRRARLLQQAKLSASTGAIEYQHNWNKMAPLVYLCMPGGLWYDDRSYSGQVNVGSLYTVALRHYNI